MVRPGAVNDGMVIASNFVRAARDSGYVSLATALAELIDNSLQASATQIDITVGRSTEHAQPTITVRDNGVGMTRAELAACLKFGGSSRFNDRRSLGRYGMGLPAASLSQARRVRVHAWQGGAAGSYVVLDVDTAVSGNTSGLAPRRASSIGGEAGYSGCQVTWEECDRIEYQRLGWLERSLAKDLGRMFRYFLQEGVRLHLNGRPVLARDPLFLADDFDGARATSPFEALSYEVATPEGGPSSVTVRFTELPVRHWHRLDTVAKRRLGVVGGAGVSVVRAGREIAFGWHLLGAKRRENYDDWWRCEIRFDPPLDEQFGITNNKQGIRPTPGLRRILEPELESMARLLNGRVRQAFESVKFEAAAERACRVAESVDDQLPAIRRSGRRPAGGTGRLTYRLKAESLGPDALLSTRVRHNTLEVTINSDHAAYAALYEPLQASADNSTGDLRTSIELLLLSFARSQAVLDADRNAAWRELPTLWSDSFAKMLRKS